MIKQVMPFVVGLFLCSTLMAQVPKQINYQGIARNAYGTALANQSISLRLTIREASATGTMVYQETRVVQTNQFGLFSTAIGSDGAGSVSGTIAAVNWANGQTKFLQVEMDPKGGSQYTSLGASPLTSVPFALRAESASPVGAAGGDLSGSFPNPTIKDGAITAAKLAPGVIPTSIPVSGTAGGDLAGTYPNPTIGANTVNTSKIADNAVNNAKLADNAVTTSKVVDGSITAAKLAPGVIPTSLPVSGTAGGDLSGLYPNPTVASNAITTAKIADNAITTAKIADNSITNAKIPDNAISSGKLQDNAVTASELSAGAVTTVKILDNAVTTAKVADGSITAAKLAPGVIPSSIPVSGNAGGDLSGTYPNPVIGVNAITTAKVADGSITAAKLAPGVIPTSIPVSGTAGGDLSGTYPNPVIAANAITTAKIADNAITTAKIPDNAISSAKLQDNAVTAAELSAGAVVTVKIADNAVTTAKVADASITAAKLAPGVIPTSIPVSGTAGGDLAGTYPNPTVAANAVTNTKIADNAITTTKVADGSITAAKLAPGVIPTSLPMSGTAGGDLTGTYPNPTIAANAITTTKIADNAISTTKINALAITNAKIADNAITTTKLADASVTAAKLAPGVIPTLFPPSGTAGGDLGGTYPNPVVGKLNGVVLSATAPTSGQVLKYNGTQWAPAADNAGGGGLTFPFSASIATTSDMFGLTNTDFGTSIAGINSSASANATGIAGRITAAAPAVNAIGVYGVINSASSANGYGVWGRHNGSGTGVYGTSINGAGVSGTSTNGYGVSGFSDNTYGIYGSSTTGSGGFFDITNAANGSDALLVTNEQYNAITASSILGNGVIGVANDISGAGIYGLHNGGGEAVVGQTISDFAGAIAGTNFGLYAGVNGKSPDGIGILAESNISGGTSGTALVAKLEVAGTGNLAIFKVGLNNVARIDRTGKGFFNGGTQSGGADVAEFFDVNGATSNYEPGDVLEISTSADRQVVKSSGPYSTLVAGVYATKPGLLLTEQDAVNSPMDNGVPMGVIGVIPTKVCLEGGQIKRGDQLVTSSISGVAMKADPEKVKVGQVIGKALQDFNADGVGKINVLVSVK